MPGVPVTPRSLRWTAQNLSMGAPACGGNC